MPEIKYKTPIHNGHLHVQKLHIQDEENSYDFEFVEKKPAVAILVFNKEMQQIVLVKQWRPISNGIELLECVAGIIEEDESAIQTAIKEIREEVGYEVPAENLFYFGEKWVSPGYLGEKFHLYIAYVNNEMKKFDGGGVESENEKIEVVHIDVRDFIDMLSEINDLKTYLLGLQFKIFIHPSL